MSREKCTVPLINYSATGRHYPGGPCGCTMVIVMARSRAGFFPVRSAFPDLAAGRRPHCRFRGLLKLYACYGLPDCSPTISGLCREVPISPVTRAHRPPAIESNHQLFEWVLPPLVIGPFGAPTRSPALPMRQSSRSQAPRHERNPSFAPEVVRTVKGLLFHVVAGAENLV